MDILKDSHFNRLSVSDPGGGRRWPDAEKVRIVEESYSAVRLGSATARQYGISNQLLHAWRKAYREGRLGCGAIGGFVPALVEPEPRAAVCLPPLGIRRMEIVSTNGRRVVVDPDVDVTALVRVIRALETVVMIPVPTGVRVWLATGYTDMRRGFPGLSLQVQEVLRRDPLSGHLFCFRGRRGDLLKVLWHDGQGACLYTKRLEKGRYLWPSPADGAVTISTAQLGYLLSGIDWRNPQENWRPTSVG